MKKLLTLLAIIAAAMLALSACGDKDDKPNTDSEQDKPTEHTHSEVIDPAVEPTCIEPGLTEGKHCSVCNEVIVAQQVISPKHNYSNGVCSGCGDKYSVGLKFTSNGDGTCYVSGIGDCTDTDIVIPSTSPNGDSVTSIGRHAFYDCDSLTSVVIPDSVTSIGDEAFYDCDSLTEITVSENNENYKSIDGNLYTKDGKTLIQYAIGKTATKFTIPDSVTSIGVQTFYDCSSLTSVVIPDSVTSIGKYAFSDCFSLTSVVIGDSVTSIGGEAFYNTALYNNKSNWENGVLYIGNHLIEAKDTISGEYAIKQGTLTIADHAFYYCTSLTSVVIGDSVTSIGYGAFNGCSSLISVVIPDSVTSIGEEAFFGCDSLASVVIPDSVTSIGGWAFFSCDSLASVVIPDSVTSIGDRAFYCCTKLTSVVIPDSVTSIGDWTFSYCNSLTDVYYTGSEAQWKSISIGDYNEELTGATIHYNYVRASQGLAFTSNGDGTCYVSAGTCTDTDVVIPPVSPDGDTVTSIGDDAFSIELYELTITSIEIPASVTEIGECAFWYCTSLKSIEIPAGVTSIGWNAFAGCKSLKSIEIPASVTSIVEPAFASCKSLAEIKVAEGNTSYKDIDGNLYNHAGTTLIRYAIGKTDSTFAVPESLTTIGGRVFTGCDSLISIDVPASITSIDDCAFAGCNSLKSVTFAEDSQITSIGTETFSWCTSLTSIEIPNSVTSIGYEAFYCCTSLTSIEIPESVTTISGGAFLGCDNLSSVVIGDSVTSIGASAFFWCHSLTDVYYTGSEEEWAAIEIGDYNECLTDATIHYNYEG